MTSKESINLKDLKSEIEWFIGKVQPETFEAGKYNVYLVKIIADENYQYCASMQYIQDSLWVSHFGMFKHFIKIRNELVLIHLSNSLKEKINLKENGIELLNSTKAITKKIYPGIAFLSSSSGYVCCFADKNIAKMYYDNSDDIPFDKKILKYLPQGETIKLDSSETKNLLRKKN